jgi:hypothetical protein
MSCEHGFESSNAPLRSDTRLRYDFSATLTNLSIDVSLINMDQTPMSSVR